MSSVYPSSIASLANPNPTDRLNSPSHSAQHADANDNIEAIEAKLGVDGSAVTTSIDYLVKNPASNGGGHVQTANKGGTGQTSYAKGDLLVAQSSSVLSKLTVGGDNQVLIADASQAVGMRWGTGATPTVRVYATSSVVANGASSFVGIWNKPSTLSYVVVETQGAGGGGGTTTSASSGADAGSSGGYSWKKVNAASLPIAASIIVGIGGSGIFGSNTAGGTSWFGSVMSATGGGTNLAAPGVGSGGDLNITGSYGTRSITTGSGGTGGSSHMGGGGKGAVAAGNGAITGGDGGKYGGGAGGAFTGSNGDDASGGSGADGVVNIIEY